MPPKYVWADLLSEYTTKAGAKDICLICFSPVPSSPVSHFNDDRGTQRNCPVHLLLRKDKDATTSERIERAIAAKKFLLTPYNNLCNAVRRSAQEDAACTGVCFCSTSMLFSF
jgi:hypothetical protein